MYELVVGGIMFTVLAIGYMVMHGDVWLWMVWMNNRPVCGRSSETLRRHDHRRFINFLVSNYHNAIGTICFASNEKIFWRM
jgi:hypothetical protein